MEMSRFNKTSFCQDKVEEPSTTFLKNNFKSLSDEVVLSERKYSKALDTYLDLKCRVFISFQLESYQNIEKHKIID
jgi:hypothetical protein